MDSNINVRSIKVLFTHDSRVRKNRLHLTWFKVSINCD